MKVCPTPPASLKLKAVGLKIREIAQATGWRARRFTSTWCVPRPTSCPGRCPQTWTRRRWRPVCSRRPRQSWPNAGPCRTGGRSTERYAAASRSCRRLRNKRRLGDRHQRICLRLRRPGQVTFLAAKSVLERSLVKKRSCSDRWPHELRDAIGRFACTLWLPQRELQGSPLVYQPVYCGSR